LIDKSEEIQLTGNDGQKRQKQVSGENSRMRMDLDRPEEENNENFPGIGKRRNDLVQVESLMRLKMKAHQHFHKFECGECINLLESIPSSMFSKSSWSQILLARCFFEKSDYKRACAIFEGVRKQFPDVLVGLECYSTCLWHLKKEVDLSHLSQEIFDLDKFSPQPWIVLGNCFSLQREHETALKFLNRAISVDPSFAYSYTLAAHEHVANEDYEKAISLYRQALSVDDRHYTAWYGLGNVFFRQQKNALAIYHFKKAISINPFSSVVRCYLGMALHANGDTVEAFNEYESASSLNPTNLVVKFQKAKLYISTNVLESAVQLLQEILQVAPREAVVHYELGSLYKQLGKSHQAVHHLQTALDLDPKDNNMIKQAVDSILS
jgi:anaphase-promoting complex subunit 3